MNGRDFINHYGKGKMSARPEFYSGRGATMTDLNSSILEMLYVGLVKEKGTEAAKRFVNLVNKIKMLSATGFLNVFYSWYADDCPEPCDESPSDMDMPIGVDYNSNEAMAVGFGTIGAMMNRGDRDDTWSIKRDFLNCHSEELDDKGVLSQRRSFGYGCFYGGEA